MKIKNRVFVTDELDIDYYLISLNRLYTKSSIGEYIIAEDRKRRNCFMGVNKDGNGLDLTYRGLHRPRQRRRREIDLQEITDENFSEYTELIANEYGDTSTRLKYCVGMTFGFTVGMCDIKFHENYKEKNPYLKAIPYPKLPETKSKKMMKKWALLSLLTPFQNRAPIKYIPHSHKEAYTYRSLANSGEVITSGIDVQVYGYEIPDVYRIFNAMYKEFSKERILEGFNKKLDVLVPEIQKKREKQRLERKKRNRRSEIRELEDELGFHRDEYIFDSIESYEDPRTRKTRRKSATQRFTNYKDPELFLVLEKIACSHVYLSALRAKLANRLVRTMKKDIFAINDDIILKTI